MIVGSGTAWAEDQTLTIDFESETSAYTDWTFTNMTSKNTNSGVNAHGGSYFGTTGGKETAFLQTKEKIAAPQSITFYVSKQTTNTTACSWYVRVSSDGSNWKQVGDAQSASSMSKGTWVEVTRDLREYENVYVQIYYTKNTAVRCIDDLTLTYATGGSVPSISADNVDIAYNATSGSIEYSLTNAEGNVSANVTSGDEWLTLGTITESAVPFTCSANTGAERTATVTLSYDGAENKVVTVTQAAFPTYFVTYDANGATSGTAPTDETAYPLDATVTVLDNTGDMTKIGCAFGGWNTQADGEGTNYSAGSTFSITANTTLYAKWNPYTITVQSNNDTYGTVSGTTTITATPNSGYRVVAGDGGYTVTSGTATVVNNGDNTFTVTPSSDCTITINFEAIPTYTAHFSVNGTIDENNDFTGIEGAAIVFPVDPDDVSGKTFVGWVTEAIDGMTDEAPSLVNSAKMGNADVIYYAVFATAGTGSSASLTKMTSSDTFSAGDKVVIVASNNIAMYQETINNSYVNKYTFDNNAETIAADDKKWFTVSAGTANNTWKLGDSTNGYVYNSTSNNLAINSSSSSDFALAWNSTESKFTLKSGSRWLSYRSDIDSKYFRMGGTGATPLGTGYFDIYKYSADGGITYSGYCTTVAAAVPVSGVSVDKTASVNVGETTILTATVSPDNATNKNVTWESSDESIATVDKNGVVTGVAAGVATITVTSVADNTKTATCTVTVTTVAVTGVSVDATASVNVGETTTLTATVSPNNATNKNVTWESSDESIATVDENGVVTGVAAGVATITVTSVADNTKTATCTVTVSVVPGTADRPYTISEAIDAIDNDGDVTDVYVEGIISQIDEYDSSYHSLTYWISADGTTEAQQFEVYSGKGIGGANFSSINDLEIGDHVVVKGNIKKYNDIYEFNYNNQLVSRVEKPACDLAKTSDIALDVKNNALTASVADYISSSSTGAYTYESADETVATVTAEGVVTGLKVGTTTITVNQAATLSYKAGSVEIPVTVADTRVAATTIPAINISSLIEGDEGTISVVDPVKADEDVTFSFESSDEDVLLIEGDEYFVVGIGTTTVTVTATASNSALYTDVTETFEVTVNAAVKSENEIETAFDSYTTVYGTNLEGLVSGSTGFDGTITATSSNSKVLTVNVDGEGNVTVTPVAVGSATVTFSAAETASFLAAEDVQQVFTVTAPEGKTTAPVSGFVKVTATEDITDGEYLIVYEDGDVAFDGSLGKLDATDNVIEVEINEGVIAATNTTKAATFTIDATAGTIQSKSGYYIGREANSNGLDSNTETQYTNSFEIDGAGDAVITASSNCVLKYNSASNQNRFRYYKSGQQDIQLYKLTAASEAVKLNTSGYATYCSVNPLDFSAAEGYTAWQITAIEGETITFGKITGTIKGGQGILLKGEAEETVNLISANSESELEYNKLFGTTAPTYIAANEYYGLSGNKFVKVNAGTVPAGKALLPASEISASARELTFVFNDGTTGISSIEKVQLTNDKYYNLNGQRVENPKKGSLYIVNGKKVIMK